MAITATERILPSSRLKGFIGPPFCAHRWTAAFAGAVWPGLFSLF
jgi:hypothetical protein